MNRIGIFSGTFDPIHIGHVEACLVAKAVCELDTVLLLVEKKPKQKTSVTPFRHRINMMELATQNYPSLQTAEVPDNNITLKNSLPLLQERFPQQEYWLIIGSDLLESIHSWPDAEQLFKHMHICIVLRKQGEEGHVKRQAAALHKQYPETTFKILPPVWSPVSSSVLRKNIAKEGYSDQIHRDVLRYIHEHKLYSSPPATSK